jgi:apolipoprotein N-acyltransferase
LAIDPYGRTLASMDSTRVDERVFVVQLPNHHVATVYSMVGELFGWLTVAGLALMVGLAIFHKRIILSTAGTPTDQQFPSA